MRWEQPRSDTVPLEWTESGEVPVAAPVRAGFGATLVECRLGLGKGNVATEYLQEGLRVRIALHL